MKKLIIDYILYIYHNFIQYDGDIYKKWANTIMKSLQYAHNLYIIVLSIVFFPAFLLTMKIEELTKTKYGKRIESVMMNYIKNI